MRTLSGRGFGREFYQCRKCLIPGAMAIEIRLPGPFNCLFEHADTTLPQAKFLSVRHVTGNDSAHRVSGSIKNQRVRKVWRNALVLLSHLFAQSLLDRFV